MKNFKNKIIINEGTNITDGKFTFGGFPKILNEVKHEIPAKGNPMDSDNLAAIGVDEFEKILKSGGHPLMAGQTENGRRGVPQKIRDTALMHLNKLKAHPQGKVDGYSADHPIFQEAQAAYDFFNTHFPAFGVEGQIADDYNIHELKRK
jgi:hypothetical protein